MPVERVHRHEEGKEIARSEKESKAVEISLGNRPAQLTEVDLANMGTQSLDLLSLTKTINPCASPSKISQPQRQPRRAARQNNSHGSRRR